MDFVTFFCSFWAQVLITRWTDWTTKNSFRGQRLGYWESWIIRHHRNVSVGCSRWTTCLFSLWWMTAPTAACTLVKEFAPYLLRSAYFCNWIPTSGLGDITPNWFLFILWRLDVTSTCFSVFQFLQRLFPSESRMKNSWHIKPNPCLLESPPFPKHRKVDARLRRIYQHNNTIKKSCKNRSSN